MSGAAARLLVAFDGAVECRSDSDAVKLSLRGQERGGGPVELLLTAAAPSELAPGEPLPSHLQEVSVFEFEAPAGVRQLLLSARELQQPLAARSLQLHRDAARAFFGAVPPLRVSYTRRLGWALLLWTLRLPGAGRWLMWLRGK